MNRIRPEQTKSVPLGQVITGTNSDPLLSTGQLMNISEKVEIPNSAFSDKTRPEISEVRTWVDANLSDLQKVNSVLYMVEELQSGSISSSYTSEVMFKLENGGITDLNITSVDVDAVNYAVTASYKTAGVLDFNDAQFQTDINAAIAGTGIAMTIVSSGSMSTTNFVITASATAGDQDVPFTIYFDDATSISDTIVNSQTVTVTTLGSTALEPDHVWNISGDAITTSFKRSNHGNVWWVDPSITLGRELYAQKGNPDRPLRVFSDVQNNITLNDSDKVVFRRGDYTISGAADTISKGNVYYVFEEGADVAVDANGRKLIEAPDGEFLHVSGFLTTDGYLSSTGTGNVFVEAEDIGQVQLYGSNSDVVNINTRYHNSRNGLTGIIETDGTGTIDTCNVHVGQIINTSPVGSPNNISYISALAAGITQLNMTIGVCKMNSYNGPQILTLTNLGGSFCNIHIGELHIDNTTFFNEQSLVGGLPGFTTTITNSKVYIEIDQIYLTSTAATTGGFQAPAFVNAKDLNFINSHVEFNIKSGVSFFNILKNGNSGFTDSSIIVNGNIEITSDENNTGSDFNMAATSFIRIGGRIKHTGTPAGNILNLVSPTSAGSIYIENGMFNTDIEAFNIVSPDSVLLTNCVFENNGTVDVVNGITTAACKNVATNATIAPTFTEVGEAITRNSAYKA
jgi:hypothetical protein